MSEILFADDDWAMRQMVADVLRAAGHQVRLASNGRAALEAVHASPPDLIVLDYRMGRPDGFEVCRSLKTDPRYEHLPVLILTGEGGLEDRIQGFDSGADDYLAKPFDARELVARVRAMLRLTRQGLDRNPTSGLPGGEAIPREFDRRRRVGEPFAVAYLDLDHFKPFGDRFGFAVADEVIREVGRVLSAVARGSDAFVGHIGGDDFILIASLDETRALVEDALERFQRALPQYIPVSVLKAGCYRSKDRNGAERDFPLTRLAAAIVHVSPQHARSLAELGETIAEAKRLAKMAKETGIAEVEAPV